MLALMVATHGAHASHTQEGQKEGQKEAKKQGSKEASKLVEALGISDSHSSSNQSDGGARLEAALEKSAMSPERVEDKMGQ